MTAENELNAGKWEAVLKYSKQFPFWELGHRERGSALG